MMKLFEINRDPSPRQLRQFSAVTLMGLPMLAWIWSGSNSTIITCAVIGAVVVAVGLARPMLLRFPFILISLITMPIGFVVSELAILLIYIGLFVPIGLCFRLLGRDKLDLKFDPAAKSYWSDKQQPRSVADYYKQF